MGLMQRVGIRLTDAPAPLAATIERIDEDHANPRRQWREMGDQTYADGTVRFDVDLPPHAIAAVTLELTPEPSVGGAAK